METLNLEIHDDVVSAVDKIRDIRATELEVEIPEGSVLFENSLSLKLIKKEAEKFGKTINFSTTDAAGQTLIELIEGNNGAATTTSIAEDFVSREVSLDEIMGTGAATGAGRALKLPNFKGMKNPFAGLFGKIRMPKGRAKFVIPLALILFFGLYWVALAAPKADVVVVVESQPLIKSVELEVGTTLKNASKERTLEGRTFTALVTKTKTGGTTGEAFVGEKAEGRIKIFNHTLTEQDFDDGEEVFSEENDDLLFTLDDDVTVPAATEDAITHVRTPGTAEVNVTAVEIGSDYNLDDGEDLEFDDFDSSDYTAEATDDFEGGSSKTVKAVTQKDMDDLAAALLAEMKSDADDSLKNAIDNGWILIEGSESETVVTKEFNHKLNDQFDEIELKQTISFQGLAYNENALNDLLDILLEEFVPDGFELSDEDREVNVEILGNTDATTLSTTSADLQVTLKSYVLPQVDEEQVKKDLAGVKISEAERVLGSIRNMKSYEINMSVKIPFLSRMPSKIENITLTVEKD